MGTQGLNNDSPSWTAYFQECGNENGYLYVPDFVPPTVLSVRGKMDVIWLHDLPLWLRTTASIGHVEGRSRVDRSVEVAGRTKTLDRDCRCPVKTKVVFNVPRPITEGKIRYFLTDSDTYNSASMI